MTSFIDEKERGAHPAKEDASSVAQATEDEDSTRDELDPYYGNAIGEQDSIYREIV